MSAPTVVQQQPHVPVVWNQLGAPRCKIGLTEIPCVGVWLPRVFCCFASCPSPVNVYVRACTSVGSRRALPAAHCLLVLCLLCYACAFADATALRALICGFPGRALPLQTADPVPCTVVCMALTPDCFSLQKSARWLCQRCRCNCAALKLPFLPAHAAALLPSAPACCGPSLERLREACFLACSAEAQKATNGSSYSAVVRQSLCGLRPEALLTPAVGCRLSTLSCPCAL